MANILLTGQYSAAGFTTESDGDTGTIVTGTGRAEVYDTLRHRPPRHRGGRNAR